MATVLPLRRLMASLVARLGSLMPLYGVETGSEKRGAAQLEGASRTGHLRIAEEGGNKQQDDGWKSRPPAHALRRDPAGLCGEASALA